MAIIDSGGVAALGGLTSLAAAGVGDQVVVPVGPADGTVYPALSIHLRATLATSGAGNSDVQWQASTSPDFATLAWSQTLVNVPDGLATVIAGPFAEDVPIYWRARSAATGTTGWGAWSPVWSVTPDLQAGHAFGYLTLNVGAQLVLDGDAAEYVPLNVGVQWTIDDLAAEYVVGNHGVEITRRPQAVEYVLLGDVDDSQPTPHIWFLRPTSGRAGEGIEVVGFGMGDLQVTYEGRLEHRPGADWLSLPISDWQTYPPTADAYTDQRVLDPVLGQIDQQHTIITFIIPAGAEPPGWPVRVVTEE